jgi:hypothetical protein
MLSNNVHSRYQIELQLERGRGGEVPDSEISRDRQLFPHNLLTQEQTATFFMPF